MHVKSKARILDKLGSQYCSERRESVRRVGAVEDYWTMNHILSGDRILENEPRAEVAKAIEEWAGRL